MVLHQFRRCIIAPLCRCFYWFAWNGNIGIGGRLRLDFATTPTFKSWREGPVFFPLPYRVRPIIFVHIEIKNKEKKRKRKKKEKRKEEKKEGRKKNMNPSFDCCLVDYWESRSSIVTSISDNTNIQRYYYQQGAVRCTSDNIER